MNRIFKIRYNTFYKKPALLILLALIFSSASAQQQILLFTETFDNGPTSIVFDATGIGSNFGSNDWTINNQFNGQPTYPNTPNEDSVLSGQINGAPISNYLHIHDNANPGGVANCNWNPTFGSDRFCYVGSPFCTLGLTDVIFTFFWFAQGDSTAYGRVYYSADGGPWIQTGLAKYSGKSKWEYESIQSPSFNNVQNLQFGFRWTNAAGDTTQDASFGIDDIIAVGSYDNINHPTNISITSITPDTVCQKDDILIGWQLSAPLCDGTYQVNLSDSIGNFSNPINEGIFDIFAPQTNGYIFIQAPQNVSGNCFKVTITRLTPAPTITSDTSICFAIHHCPVNIVTNVAPVMNDADTTCVRSAIDVKFNSFGNFNNNNVYYAQLSDTNGSFAHADTLGHLVSNQAYPGLPGTVSGLIPANAPPGCGYYIRVVSSNPASDGTVIGPFCLTDCDITTNQTHDIQVCINYPYPTDTVQLAINDHQWNSHAHYDTCNNWTVELLDMNSFGVVNIGGLAVYHDSVSGTFNLIIGPLNTLPVAPGSYYMRIISNCSSDPWNQTGTVIRITIGAPASDPPSIISTQADSVYCNAGLLDLFVVPYNPNSIYYWNSNLFNFGLPIKEPANEFLGNLTGAPVGSYVFYVREQNYGCYGPSSAAYVYDIISTPKVHITGPTKVCLGDTATFFVTYLPRTYYSWSAQKGVDIVLASNSEVSMAFDSIGTFKIGNFSLNSCGSDSGTYQVKVFSLFDVNLGPDKESCFGDTVHLDANVPPYPKTFISLDSSTQGNQGGMFNIVAHNDIIIDSFAVSFRTRTANTKTAIYSKPGTYRNYEQTASSWYLLATNTIALPGPVLSKTVIPSELNKTIRSGDTVAFYITTTNTPAINEAYGNGIGIQQGVVFKSDGVIDFVQGCVNAYPFGAHIGPKVLDVTVYYRTKAGLKYSWTTGDTTSAINFTPGQSNFYQVKVYDTTGCKAQDSIFVKIDTLPRVYAGPDTLICPNSNYLMPATASPSAILNWTPTIGLNQPDSLQPVFNYNQSTSYVLTAIDPDGCKKSDSVSLNVFPLSVNAGPDTSICDAESYIMIGTASTDSIEWFPAVGLSAVNSLTPTFTYDQTTIYYLQVSDTNGCKLKDSVVISVVYCNTYIKVPDAFTPNNDGNNDHFTVYGKYISDYQIKIFNRWGEEVYSSDDVNELNNLSKGWDGTFRGKIQDVGTFVYVITAKDLNGKNILKKGNLTLIR